MPRRRAIAALLVLVFLGATATVASSWTIHAAHWFARDRARSSPLAYWHTGITPMPSEAWDAVRVPSTVPLQLHGTSVQSSFSRAQIGIGWLREWHEAGALFGDSAKPGYVDEILTRTTIGWPWPALRRDDYEATHVYGGNGFTIAETPGASVRGGIVFRSTATSPFVEPFALPLLPLWPGFAINTIFYALLLFLAWRTPGLIRRAVRRRRGRCVRCGYDRSGLDAGEACPECGTGVVAHARQP